MISILLYVVKCGKLILTELQHLFIDYLVYVEPKHDCPSLENASLMLYNLYYFVGGSAR
jgi:hypothetical protein